MLKLKPAITYGKWGRNILFIIITTIFVLCQLYVGNLKYLDNFCLRYFLLRNKNKQKCEQNKKRQLDKPTLRKYIVVEYLV